MGERIDEWPRVHTCLHNWCPKKHEGCSQCNAVVAIVAILAADKEPPEATFTNVDDMLTYLNEPTERLK